MQKYSSHDRRLFTGCRPSEISSYQRSGVRIIQKVLYRNRVAKNIQESQLEKARTYAAGVNFCIQLSSQCIWFLRLFPAFIDQRDRISSLG